MVVALGLVVALYVGPVRSLLHAREEAATLRTEVHQLDAHGRGLRAELKALETDTAMIALARQNGYIFPGETPFVAHLDGRAARTTP